MKWFDFIPIAILFSDEDGYIISRSGHDEILKLLDHGNVRAGTSIKEYSIGTTAPGICLEEGRTTGLIAEEHYFQSFHWASCIATPIFDQGNNLIGSLDFTSTVDAGKDMNLLIPLLHSIANSIRFELWLKRKLQQLEIYDSYFHNIFHYSDSTLILVNRTGEVVELNRTGQELFRIKSEDVVSQDVRKIIGNSSNLSFPLKRFSNSKINLQTSAGSGTYSMESIPIYDQTGYEIAFLLKLEKRKALTAIARKGPYDTRYSFNDIIGRSEKMKHLVRLARKVSRSRSNILIEGDTGSGKELFAQAIHNESPFSEGPFIAINCAAIPSELIESELFGYEKGAYSGARPGGNVGKFELANEGTIFLDEIHAMDVSAQMKILRVLEDRTLTKIGGNQPIALNIRVIAACSKSLSEEVKNDKFLDALYFRLNVVRLSIPPLSKRKEDIPLLVDYFIKKANLVFQRQIKGITPDALDLLCGYSWPGNVRELKNCIERAFNVSDGQVISVEDISIDDTEVIIPGNTAAKVQTVEETTKSILVDSLNRFDTVKEAAESMGISVSTFYRKMKKYGLSK